MLRTIRTGQQVAFWEQSLASLTEVFTYGQAGLDGYGGSSYIDDVVCRERDPNQSGSLRERYYYLQNWRNDVVAIMDSDGTLKERVFYDAYGRPHAFSPGDIKTAGGADRPDGILDANDTWTTGSVLWNKDLGNSSGAAIPDGSVTAADGTTLTNLKAAGYSAGYGILSDSAVGNRKGYAGYEFDEILNGAASADNKVLYHVRHRVLASDTGKWLQKDPLGYHDSMDLYEYCASRAIGGIDPSGLGYSLPEDAPCLEYTYRIQNGDGRTGPLVIPGIPVPLFYSVEVNWGFEIRRRDCKCANGGVRIDWSLEGLVECSGSIGAGFAKKFTAFGFDIQAWVGLRITASARARLGAGGVSQLCDGSTIVPRFCLGGIDIRGAIEGGGEASIRSGWFGNYSVGIVVYGEIKTTANICIICPSWDDCRLDFFDIGSFGGSWGIRVGGIFGFDVPFGVFGSGGRDGSVTSSGSGGGGLVRLR